MRGLVLARRGALLLALLLGLSASPATGGEALESVQEQFREVIKRLGPASVVCVARGVSGTRSGHSSGVIITADGYVLSDGDAGLVYRREADGTNSRTWSRRVTVRVPGRSLGAHVAYEGRVIHRDRNVDTSLIKIVGAPRRGLPHVLPGSSDAVAVGDFAFVVGSNVVKENTVIPTITSGLVAALEPARINGTGAHEALYVSAGVNEGVNGGPVVDLDGHLVGTVSRAVDPETDERYQFLGLVIPMARILAAYDDVPAAAPAFATLAVAERGRTPGRALETAVHGAVERAAPFVVSLDITREAPVSAVQPLGEKTVTVTRYQGPVSGILADPAGHVVTSLYNLTNVAALVDPLWKVPAGAGVKEGLEAVQAVTVHVRDGRSWDARVVGTDARLGLAVLAPVDAEAVPEDLPLPPAGAAEPLRGRFVVAVGHPHGKDTRRSPLASFGVLSKFHAEGTDKPWRGHWQTDAAGTDANAGGAVMDLRGNLLGMMALWHPAKHGRASGVAFVMPWARIREGLAGMLEGHRPAPGYLGVRFGRGLRVVVDTVLDDGPAKAAGLEAGDEILTMNGKAMGSLLDAITWIRTRYAGEVIRLRVQRDGQELDLEVILAPRPADADAPPPEPSEDDDGA